MSQIVIASENDAIHEKAARFVEKQIGTALAKAYPSRSWYLDALIDQGVMTIKIPQISIKHGFILHLGDELPVLCKRAVMMGGEFLERFRLSTSRFDDGEDMMMLDRNILGEVRGAKLGELAR